MSRLPIIAIIGRPNVGKSTLFNRLAGRRLAIVDDTPGVTRDRREAQARLGDLRFRLIDTAGLEEGPPDSLSARMRKQTDAAIEDADIVLFLVDARAGITPLDEVFADHLRPLDKPVLLLANKAEGRHGEFGAYEAFALGLGDPLPVSAAHGDGLAVLYEELRRLIEEGPLAERLAPEAKTRDGDESCADDETQGASFEVDPALGGLVEGDLDFAFADERAETIDGRALREEDHGDLPPARPLKLAIVGRPNVGKSTLVNRLVGEERMLTGPEAGLTRDAIAVEWEWRERPVQLFDTAGLRRRSRIEDRLEQLSVADTLNAIRFAEVVVLMIDATQGLHRQDLKIASHIAEEGRAAVIALNKWDLIKDRLKLKREIAEQIERQLPQLRGIEQVHVSALEGKGLDRLMAAVERAEQRWNARIQTSVFNRFLAATVDRHPPPAVQGRRTKIRFGAQIKTRPPTFALFANHPKAVDERWLR
ncbi:MAG: ribosome biogenesis GTPase Der, partial [Alphaproteobacteria bacterium]